MEECADHNCFDLLAIIIIFHLFPCHTCYTVQLTKHCPKTFHVMTIKVNTVK